MALLNLASSLSCWHPEQQAHGLSLHHFSERPCDNEDVGYAYADSGVLLSDDEVDPWWRPAFLFPADADAGKDVSSGEEMIASESTRASESLWDSFSRSILGGPEDSCMSEDVIDGAASAVPETSLLPSYGYQPRRHGHELLLLGTAPDGVVGGLQARVAPGSCRESSRGGKERWLQERAAWLRVPLSEVAAEPKRSADAFEREGTLLPFLEARVAGKRRRDRSQKEARQADYQGESSGDELSEGEAEAVRRSVRRNSVFGFEYRFEQESFSRPLPLGQVLRHVERVWMDDSD